VYAALWRVLPGTTWIKTLILVVAGLVVLTALVLWVFPFVSEVIAPQDVTVTH
jgi:hypothetical protein